VTATSVDMTGVPRASRLKVIRWGTRLSLRYHARALVVGGLLWLATGIFLLVQLGVGEYQMSPAEVFATLTGHGAPNQELIIYTLRLPRVLTAVLVGIALGMSGAVFQSLTRNPLGSPTSSASPRAPRSPPSRRSSSSTATRSRSRCPRWEAG
jgi:iron complex transport system permease protein